LVKGFQQDSQTYLSTTNDTKNPPIKKNIATAMRPPLMIKN